MAEPTHTTDPAGPSPSTEKREDLTAKVILDYGSATPRNWVPWVLGMLCLANAVSMVLVVAVKVAAVGEFFVGALDSEFEIG